MWFLLVSLQIFSIQGMNRVVLRGSDSPCKGRLEVYRERDRQWGLVTHHGWSNTCGEVVCRSLGCGPLINTDKELSLYHDPPLPNLYLMDQVNCASTEQSLWNCPHAEANTELSTEKGFVAVKCSGNVSLSLNINGRRNECAGVVQFTTHNHVISVCNSEWNKDKANKICEQLNCGQHYYIPKPGLFEVQQNRLMGLLKCLRNEEFLWQCVEWPTACEHPASVICTKHRRFRLQGGEDLCSGSVEEHDVTNKLWVPLLRTDVAAETICTQLSCGTSGNFTHAAGNDSLHLTCTGKVKLSNFTSVCFGTVYVNINGSEHAVCYSNTHSRELGKVVCRELGCGEVLHVKQGSWVNNGWLSNMECQGDEASLWHCLANHKNTACPSTAVTCAGSLEVRLSDGFSDCSGRVEVKSEGLWRSVNSKDWTNENSDVVCQHLGCGRSTQMTEDIFVEGNLQQMEMGWEVKCKSSSAKLHECFQRTPAKPERSAANQKPKQIICQNEQVCKTQNDDHRERNSTHTTVTCPGSVNVSLSNPNEDRCWGSVTVCGEDSCGGVCIKTWRTEHSRMLCENLGCGHPINSQLPLRSQNSVSVRYYSVYCPPGVKNISLCNFIPNKDQLCTAHASVICTGSVKAKLEDSRDKCAGEVQLFYAGNWMPVCIDSLDGNVRNSVCRELNCGQAVSTVKSVYGDFQTEGLSRIRCSQDADSVLKCNISDMSERSCSVGYLRCSEWARLLLYKKEGECSGPVYALSAAQTPVLLSSQGWSREEGQALCQYLQCGNYISHSGKPENTSKWWNKAYNCQGMKNIWDCESNRPSSQSQKHEVHSHLNIRCDGKGLKVSLSNPCTGNVLINMTHMCAYWDKTMSDNLCDSLNCGKAISHRESQVSSGSEGWRVSCTGKETLLGQCSYQRDKCDKIISVACQDGVKFRTTEKCGGLLGVNFEGNWEYVCGDLNAHDTAKICEALDCDNGQTLLDQRHINKKMDNRIRVSIKCSGNKQKISQCLQLLPDNKKDACRHKPAKIQCAGYVPAVNSTQGNRTVIAGICLGVLGMLVVIIIMQRKRLLSVLRRHRNKNINRNGNEMNNMETEDRDSSERKMSMFDHDDYEDVDTVRNNDDDADDGSKGSSGTEYDDVEEQASDVPHPHDDDEHTLPLLPKRPENLLDEVTYEVELEKQEDYDDVMPGEALANENTGIPMTETADVITDAAANTDVLDAEVQALSKEETM